MNVASEDCFFVPCCAPHLALIVAWFTFGLKMKKAYFGLFLSAWVLRLSQSNTHTGLWKAVKKKFFKISSLRWSKTQIGLTETAGEVCIQLLLFCLSFPCQLLVLEWINGSGKLQATITHVWSVSLSTFQNTNLAITCMWGVQSEI